MRLMLAAIIAALSLSGSHAHAEITGVTAGTGLTGGGTSGNIMLGLAVPVAVANGGTGANNATDAQANLAIGKLALQSAGAVAITGGTISGVTVSGVTVSGGDVSGATVTVPALPAPSGGTTPTVPTARTLAARFAEMINVLDQGALCNGSNDDAPTLNKILGSTLPSGAVICFPPGLTCLVSTPLVVPGNVTLFAYPGTVTLGPTANNTGGSLLMAVNQRADVLIYGLTLDGGLSASGPTNTASLVTVFLSHDVVFDHVRFQNSRAYALNASNDHNTGIRDSTLYNIGNLWQTSKQASDVVNGISFCCADHETSISQNYGNFVTGTTLTNIGGAAIILSEQQNFLIANNRFNLWGATEWNNVASGNSPGINIYNINAVSIVSNQIYNAPGNGIEFVSTAPTSSAVVSGNWVQGSGGAGLLLSSISNATISGNSFLSGYQSANSTVSKSAWSSGINLFGTVGPNVTITGNTASNQMTQVGTLAAGSATITGLNNTAFMPVGSTVTGDGVPAGATVASVVDGGTITISANATLPSGTTLTSATLTFAAGSQFYGLQKNNGPALNAVWIDQSNAFDGNAVGNLSAGVSFSFGRAGRTPYAPPGTGFNYTVPGSASVLEIKPSGALASGTIVLPSTDGTPSMGTPALADGQLLWILSTQAISTLTVSPNTGQTVSGAPSSIGPTTPVAFLWDKPTSTWIRFQ